MAAGHQDISNYCKIGSDIPWARREGRNGVRSMKGSGAVVRKTQEEKAEE